MHWLRARWRLRRGPASRLAPPGAPPPGGAPPGGRARRLAPLRARPSSGSTKLSCTGAGHTSCGGDGNSPRPTPRQWGSTEARLGAKAGRVQLLFLPQARMRAQRPGQPQRPSPPGAAHKGGGGLRCWRPSAGRGSEHPLLLRPPSPQVALRSAGRSSLPDAGRNERRLEALRKRLGWTPVGRPCCTPAEWLACPRGPGRGFTAAPCIGSSMQRLPATHGPRQQLVPPSAHPAPSPASSRLLLPPAARCPSCVTGSSCCSSRCPSTLWAGAPGASARLQQRGRRAAVMLAAAAMLAAAMQRSWPQRSSPGAS
jgi:hypothetical protein